MFSGPVVNFATYINCISSWLPNRVWSIQNNTWFPNLFYGISDIDLFHVIQNSFVHTGFPVIDFYFSLLSVKVLFLVICIIRMF